MYIYIYIYIYKTITLNKEEIKIIIDNRLK